EDALRTALRLGDSVLIVGEVRSTEAKALYEAMRIGAVGNVVMGTIHGESAYSIWDRVVNDLGVPTTSFKATDFAIVSAPIRFKGSLKRFRRLIEVTEVKKHWENDPDREGGLLQWMTFDASKDKLDFFEDVVMKESEWLQRVKRVRGLTVKEIFDEVKSRGETKQYLVDVAKKLDMPQIMEADYSVRAHNKYVLMADAMRTEIGGIEYPELLKNWRTWIDGTLTRDVQAVLAGKKPLA
ncbi:Flp pilus assembly complex ATPase component TadA, partial [Candidatus Micrarchaeota archaeon]|nr:Flp pilus assembly complex ATPase component TadA [Candidatus Micrarchaeota archaeon]